MGPAMFERLDESTVLPTEYARGPWVDTALHGAPTAALLAQLCDEVSGDDGLQPTRVTVELLAPVPLAPLDTTVDVIRSGRSINLTEAKLHHEGRLVASARLAQIRTTDLPLPSVAAELSGPDAVPVPGPASLTVEQPAWAPDDTIRFHTHATEHRFASGVWGEPGPAFDWIRLASPVFANTPISPLIAVIGVADFGNGISAPLPSESWTFINPDLTVHLHRLPSGPWVGLQAHCFVNRSGIGQSNAELFDENGHIGHANQSLLLAPMPDTVSGT